MWEKQNITLLIFPRRKQPRDMLYISLDDPIKLDLYYLSNYIANTRKL